MQWDETKKVWCFSDPKFNSYRTIDLDAECMELLKRERDKQIKAKDYYTELYTENYENEERHLNTTDGGKFIPLINIR